MICNTCKGNHHIIKRDGRVEPCPTCIGGVDHCCGGDLVTDYCEAEQQLDLFNWAHAQERYKE